MQKILAFKKTKKQWICNIPVSNFNETLTNDVVNFEQPAPGYGYMTTCFKLHANQFKSSQNLFKVGNDNRLILALDYMRKQNAVSATIMNGVCLQHTESYNELSPLLRAQY